MADNSTKGEEKKRGGSGQKIKNKWGKINAKSFLQVAQGRQGGEDASRDEGDAVDGEVAGWGEGERPKVRLKKERDSRMKRTYRMRSCERFGNGSESEVKELDWRFLWCDDKRNISEQRKP